jgi:hypothetical protein
MRTLNLDDFMGDEPTSVAVGVNIKKKLPKMSIAIGHNATAPSDYSVIVATGPNKFIDPNSNINIAHVMEANSKSKDVIFPSDVTTHGSFYYKDQLMIGEIQQCDACYLEDADTKIGFQWNTGDNLGMLCLNCIRIVTMQHRARERWIEKTGDPIANLQNQIDQLHRAIELLKK